MTHIKTAARTPEPENLDIWLYINNEKIQSGNTNEMIWGVAEQIAYLSTLWELKPGDLIMTGTPAGVGAIKRGDALEGGVQGVGVLKVNFKA